MRDTSWRDDHTRIVKRRAVSYTAQGSRFSTLMPFEDSYGNGGLLTTVGDLLKWNANLAKPAVGGTALVAAMEQRGRLNDGNENQYSLGLYIRTYRGHRVIDHSGGTAGYSAHLARYPDDGLSLVVLCNINPGPSSFGVQGIADLLLTPEQTPDQSSSLPLGPGDRARFSGLYRSATPASAASPRPLSVINITGDDGGLVSPALGPLVRVADTRFSAELQGTILEFEGGGQLRVTNRLGTSDTYQRVDRWQPSRRELQSIVGGYTNDEIQTTLHLVLDGERLVMRRDPNRDVTLTPVFEDSFSYPRGWVTLHRDSAQNIVGLSVQQEGVWDLRFFR